MTKTKSPRRTQAESITKTRVADVVPRENRFVKSPRLRRIQPRLSVVTLIVQLTLLALAVFSPTADALTFQVTKTADTADGICDADCSLREAIIAANANIGADVITFVDLGGAPDIYLLTIVNQFAFDDGEGDLDITDDVTITGNGAASTFIQAGTTADNGIDRVFDVAASSVTFETLTIRHGRNVNDLLPFGSTPGGGGAIAVRDPVGVRSVTVTSCSITDNTAALGGGGGAIFLATNPTSTLTITGSTLTNNSTIGALPGGGIFADGGTSVTISNTNISSNTTSGDGGGINCNDCILSVNPGSTISNNTAGAKGGGVLAEGFLSDVRATTASFLNNTASTGDGGGIFAGFGLLILVTSTISGNTAGEDGGGIACIDCALTMTDTTVSDNVANFTTQAGAGGGGLIITGTERTPIIDGVTISGNMTFGSGGGLAQPSGTVTINMTNSTISGNEAFRDGGGFFLNNVDGSTTMQSVTITENRASEADGRTNIGGADGGGVFLGSGSIQVRNSIIAGNFDPQDGSSPDVSGAIASLGNNLVGMNDGAAASFPAGFPNGNTDFVGTSASPVDADLGPLQDNGGPTLTHALLLASPARDAASSATSPAVDQRGVTRPSGAGDDIGAFELDLSMGDLSLTKSVDNPLAGLNDTVVFTITVTNEGPGDATSVVVTDVAPVGLTFNSSNPSQGTFVAPAWNLGALAAGASATLDITATVTTTTAVVNSAEITTIMGVTDPDSTPNNNDPSEDDQASAGIGSADLRLTKTVNVPTAALGDPVSFTVSVTNDGPQDASGVIVKDVAPPGLTGIVSTPSQGSYNGSSWDIGTIGVAGTVTLTIAGTANANGDITNTAEVSASDLQDPDSTPDNNIPAEDDQDSATVTVPDADISLSVFVDNTAPATGESVTFNLVIMNTGVDPVTGVQVTSLLPAGLDFISALPTTGTYDAGTGQWAISSVGRGEELRISARVTVVGTITMGAEVTAADQLDPDSTPNNNILAEDDQDSIDLTATAPSGVAVSVLVVDTLVDENDGSGAGAGTSLRDAIAESLTSDGTSSSSLILFDASLLGGTITLTLGDLVIDKDITIDGPGPGQLTISGGNTQRIFYVNVAPSAFGTRIATIKDLTIANGRAQGGGGGAGLSGGGGGGAAGMGGGAFIENGSVLVVVNGVFDGNSAGGGNGGNSFGTGIVGGGGGGGMGGSGVTPTIDNDGGTGGGGGILGGAAGAGGSGAAGGNGGDGAGGGGGGGNTTGDMSGGRGGFGGGGAGGGIVDDASTADGENGGYGGGGGGAGSFNGGTSDGVAGLGGLFGGAGVALAKSSPNGGGGGAGMGGAVFIREGGTLTASQTTFQNNFTAGGVGGSNATAGQGKGGAIFVMLGGTFIEDTNTYTGNTAAEATGSSIDSDDIYGLSLSGSLVVSIATDEDDADLSGNDLSLREAIVYSAPGDTITFDPLLSSLTVNLGDLFIDKDLTITGPGAGSLTVDGGNAQRLFFINSGTVTIENLTIANGRAAGFAGGAGESGGAGGGSAGMGGGIFVNQSANLTMSGVDFTSNAAVGGNGGASAQAGNAGGGGGGGFGSTGAATAGAGTGGAGGNGGSLGGTGGASGTDGTEGGAGGGGGTGDAGNGGFAAGGGGGGNGSGSTLGGTGGYGAGGGGGGVLGTNAGGGGGFGGGAGGTDISGAGGGGGGGMGGGLFVRDGATVTISNTSFTSNTAAAGTGGSLGGADGLGKGGGLFLMSGATFINGGGLTFSGNTAEDAGAPGSLDNNDAFGLSLGGGVNVTIANDEDDGDLSATDLSLREAIANAVAGDVITFDMALTTLTLTLGDLFIDKDLTIMGNGVANTSIDAGGAQRIFFVNSGAVTIQDLTIINGTALGGDGGAAEAAGSGGGAAGMGGAIFVNSTAALTVSGVDFMDNSAIGGNGGTTGALLFLAVGAGGGGFGGNGKTNQTLDAMPNFNGGNGGPSGSLGGQDGFGTTAEGRDGEDGNGGGGGGNAVAATTDGGIGGFAGGGGGGGVAGTSSNGGDGGFGGGGGGTGTVGASTTGTGGFGGGNGGLDIIGAGGGGGAGFGGAIFLRENASLAISNSSFVNSTATAGTAGIPGTATAGLAKGGAIFVMSGATLVNNGNVTFGTSTAADAGGSTFDTVDVFGVAFGGTVTVDNATDEEDGNLSVGNVSLREAIANAAPGNTIEFAGALAGATLTLTLGDLVINKDLTIDGAAAAPLAISGGTTQRVFFVDSGTVLIQNLTITGGNAQGGNGGAGDGQSGGGGAGLGGGLFVNTGADVTVENVIFDNNMATGGVGGSNTSTGGSGSGGGGIGGNGSDPASGGDGGAGGALGGAGGAGTSLSGVDGIAGGDGAGGGGGGASSVALRPGGSGGAGGFGAGGGAGGSATAPAVQSGPGGPGGFGGGGGGAGFASGAIELGSAGIGGLFAGNGGSSANLPNGGGGGGGLGAGAFVRDGASLTIKDSTFTNNSATGGGGGVKSAGGNGQGKGGAIFVMDAGVLANQGGNTFNGNTASDQSGAIGDNDDVFQGVVAGLTVTTLNDELDPAFDAADLSLREAIDAALPGDVIDFDPALTPGTIALDPVLGELAITGSLRIDGPGADLIAISGQDQMRVFNVSDSDPATDRVVSINGLTIADGRAVTGSGILNEEALTLRDSAILSNIATAGNGAGLSSTDGAATIERTLFAGNDASAGGAIANLATMTITDSTISGNSTTGSGGGIFNGAGGTLNLTNGTVAFNSTSRPSETSGGVFNDAAGTLTIANTIIAGNTNASPGIASDVAGAVIGDANNLIGDTSGSTGFGMSDLVLADLGITGLGNVLVGTLADNGGPTMTHALVGQSVALDAGDNAFTAATDQRGLTRIVDSTFTGTPTVDIGAYEYDGPVSVATPVTVTANEDDPPLDNALDLNVLFEDVNDADTSLIYAVDFLGVSGIINAVIDGTGMLDLTFLPNGFGNVIIVLRATDPDGQHADAILAVQVAAVNDNPTAVDDPVAGIAEDSVNNVLDVLANDSIAPDIDETLTVSAVGPTSDGGTVTNNGVNLSYTPAPDFFGTETFTYTVDDGNGGSAQATVSVTVNNVNDNPTANDDSFPGILVNSVANVLNVLANDSSAPDAGETLTITAVGPTSDGGTVTNNGADLSYTPATDFSGIETFTYTINDGNGGTAQATVSVLVGVVNTPPTATDDLFTGIIEDSVGNSLDVLANDVGGDVFPEVLTVTNVGATSNGGDATIAPDGLSITYTPAPDFFGTETFDYTVDDGNGGTDTATVTVEVDNVNDPPTAVDDIFQVLLNSTNNTLDVLANDSAAPDTGETLTITNVSTPANGVAMIVTGATISYTPPMGFIGTDTFTYTIDDGKGATDTATVMVSICQLSTVDVLNPIDGVEIIVGIGTPFLTFNFQAITDCPSDVAEVTFDLDGAVLGTSTTAPFTLIHTDVTAMLLGAHTLTVTATSASDSTIMVQTTSNFTIRLATAADDSNADCIPDDPFVTAPLVGNVWYCADATVPGFAVATLNLQPNCAPGALPQTLTIEDPDDPTRRVTITVPCDLLEAGETASLIAVLGQDTNSVLGIDEAMLLAAEPGVLTLGGQFIEISIIVSNDGGATFDEIDSARLAANPLSILVEGLAGVDADTGLYSHPTFVDSDPTTGLMVVSEVGDWSTAGFTNVAITSTTISADIVSLSIAAPFGVAAAPPPPPKPIPFCGVSGFQADRGQHFIGDILVLFAMIALIATYSRRTSSSRANEK